MAYVAIALAAAAALQPGSQAPAFSLPSSGGGSVALADFKGRTVVLAFFPKAFTGG